MGVSSLFFAALSVAFAAFVYLAVKPITFAPIQPLEEKWWGEGERREENPEVTPFEIKFCRAEYDDTLRRLKSTRYFESLEGVNWTYGTRPDFMKKVVDHWIKTYSWQAQIDYLNKFSHFKTNIDGISLHFIHMKPKDVKQGTKVLPIILMHGWPGSFFEFHKVVPLLLEEKDGIAFEIVIPSLPGYGYSSSPRKPGLSPEYIAVLMRKLMLRLGFDSFYAQGGDWGSEITKMIARLFPNNVKGLHLNFWPQFTHPRYPILTFVFGAIAPSLVLPEKSERDKIFPIFGPVWKNLLENTGYSHIQATKPDTVAFGLNDSPAGLASYMLEKFEMLFDGRKCQEKDVLSCLLTKFTFDELLTNIMIYWDTKSMPSAVRLYKESIQSSNLHLSMYPITVPTGFAEFPREAFPPPRSWVEASSTNLVSYSIMKNGGHFAAFEEPEEFSEDVRRFVVKVEASQF